MRELTKVYVFSRREENAVRYCAEMMKPGSECELVPTTDLSVLAECDIITTATTSATPVFDDAHIGEAVHINAIGSLGPTRSEIPGAIIERATIVVDQREACLKEAGELLPLIADGRLSADFKPAELGEIVTDSNYRAEQKVTVFKSAGNAVQDLVCAVEVMKSADASQSIRF